MYKIKLKESFLENDYVSMWIENGILFVEYKPGFLWTVEMSKKVVEDRLKLSNGITRPVFVDGRNFISTDRATMKYNKTPDVVKCISAAVFYIDDYVHQLAGNIFLALKKPLVPTKLFTDKEKGLEWLEKYKYLS